MLNVQEKAFTSNELPNSTYKTAGFSGNRADLGVRNFSGVVTVSDISECE